VGGPEYRGVKPRRQVAGREGRGRCDLRIACVLGMPRGPAWFRPDRGTGRAGAAGVRAMAAVRRGDFAGAALGDGAGPPYPEHDAGDAGRHRCCAVRRAPLALDAGQATPAAAVGRGFLVGGRMTLADISAGYPLNNMGKPDSASLLGPRATAYRERLLARPAFQRAAAVPKWYKSSAWSPPRKIFEHAEFNGLLGS